LCPAEKGLSNLSQLCLGGTQVTDAGLVHLTSLTRLSQLYLVNTQVTDAGIKELKRAVPSLAIYH
jgi:internalin A